MTEFVLREISLLNSYTLGQLLKELAALYANLSVGSSSFFSSMYMIDDFDDYVKKLSLEEVAKLIKDILDWAHK